MIRRIGIILSVWVGCTNVLLAQSYGVNYGNGLPATDALGRKLSLAEEVGEPKKDKYIAMFYWIWHQGIDDTTYQVKNITEIVRKYPEAMKDYNHPAWGTKKPGYFYWEEPLLGYYQTTDRNWMMLFIDTDRNKATGWNGYDFIINRISPKRRKAVVEKNVEGRWEWEQAAEVRFAVAGNKLELGIPRDVLGLLNEIIDIEFKWNDNMQENGNIMDFYVNGDTAPGGRFNFIYSEK